MGVSSLVNKFDWQNNPTANISEEMGGVISEQIMFNNIACGWNTHKSAVFTCVRKAYRVLFQKNKWSTDNMRSKSEVQLF